MNNRAVFLWMERVWLGLALISLVAAGYYINQNNWESGRVGLFATFCAGLMWGLRRYQRKKIDASGK